MYWIEACSRGDEVRDHGDNAHNSIDLVTHFDRGSANLYFPLSLLNGSGLFMNEIQ
jgi:hypothetical protein